MLVFLLHRILQKLTAMAHDKVLMKVEKALNFWVEDMNRKRVCLFITLFFKFIYYACSITISNTTCFVGLHSYLFSKIAYLLYTQVNVSFAC